MGYSTRSGLRGALRAALIAAGMGLLAGCGATLSRVPLIGEPEDAPRSAGAPVEFPDVGAKVGPEQKPMTAEERAKLQQELTLARDRAAAERRQRIQEESAR